MHDAFVLAAGLGTRMRPLTAHRPKPLVPVCGVPLLAYSLALCARHGLRDVIVNAHWLHEQVERWAGEWEGVRVTVSTELPEVLGTGGGLKKVADRMAPVFVVLNGDVLHEVDLTRLRDAVPPGGAAMALRPDGDAAPRYGVVAADASGTVVRLTSLASAEAEGEVRDDTHFTGIHALSREALDHVPDGVACIVRTAYAALVPGRRVGSVRYRGPWLDAGDPASYLDANLAVLSGKVLSALDPLPRAAFGRIGVHLQGSPQAAVDGCCWVGPGARIGRKVILKDAVVGAGAVVPDGTVLKRTVVWDNAEVPRGEYDRAIVYEGGVLELAAATPS